MIDFDPDAALELLDAGDRYEEKRPGLGVAFRHAAREVLDVIESGPLGFPVHPFAPAPEVRRALFPKPWPFAFAFLVRGDGVRVLACEHFRQMPAYWGRRAKI